MLFEVIEHHEVEKWNERLKLFSQRDVYYLNQYFTKGEYSDKGEPLLIFYEGESGMLLSYVVQQYDIAWSTTFNGLKPNTYFDWSSPYGYGGPLIEQHNYQDMRVFFDLLTQWCKANKIISQFIRFHPLISNYEVWKEFCVQRLEKHSVMIDISIKEKIWENLSSKNRNMIRKAKKSSIRIYEDRNFEYYSNFIQLYYFTMKRNNSDEYFYFSTNYFLELKENLGSHLSLFHALYDGRIISSSLILTYGDFIHYHLSGADSKYLNLAPNNLLLYEIAKWGNETGRQIFHLGGGVTDNDSLFAFKKSFNKNGILDFYIGANIFCEEEYDYLLSYRRQKNPDFNGRNRMIQYRSGD